MVNNGWVVAQGEGDIVGARHSFISGGPGVGFGALPAHLNPKTGQDRTGLERARMGHWLPRHTGHQRARRRL